MNDYTRRDRVRIASRKNRVLSGYVLMSLGRKMCGAWLIIFLDNLCGFIFFFFSSRRRHTRWNCDWSSYVCSSDLAAKPGRKRGRRKGMLHGLGSHEHERDILDQYLHEVSKTPLLTQKEEIALARKVRAGDQESMQELVKRNLRFVISVAKKYQNRGLPLTDLIGE